MKAAEVRVFLYDIWPNGNIGMRLCTVTIGAEKRMHAKADSAPQRENAVAQECRRDPIHRRYGNGEGRRNETKEEARAFHAP